MFYNKWIWINRFITSIFRHHTDKSGMWKNYKCFGWVIVKSLTQNHSSPVLIPNRFVVVNVFEKDTPFEMKITSDWDEDYFLWMKSWSWMVAWLKRVFSVSEYGSVQIILHKVKWKRFIHVMAYAANANFTTYSSDFIWLYGTYPEIAQTVIEEAKVTCGNMHVIQR